MAGLAGFSANIPIFERLKITVNMSLPQQANATRHYLLLTFAIFVGLVGVYLRFAGESPVFSIASNIILVIGVIIALKAVFTIMK